jgi:uncharacterized protein YndB with AHSA1/START domain
MAEFATSIDIAAPPNVVFAHLVTPEGMVAWMGQHAELDPRPDGTFAVDINGSPVRGRYLEVDPPRRVVVLWGVAGSEVDLPEERAPGYARGWEHFLPRLAVAAPGGDPGIDPWVDRWAREP